MKNKSKYRKKRTTLTHWDLGVILDFSYLSYLWIPSIASLKSLLYFHTVFSAHTGSSISPGLGASSLFTYILPNPYNIFCACAALGFASVMSDSATPWTVACQAPLSMGFFRQEYRSGLPCAPPRDLPNPGIKPASPLSPASQADSLPLSHQESPYNDS